MKARSKSKFKVGEIVNLVTHITSHTIIVKIVQKLSSGEYIVKEYKPHSEAFTLYALRRFLFRDFCEKCIYSHKCLPNNYVCVFESRLQKIPKLKRVLLYKK